MASLNTKPFSSSKRQHQLLVIAARKRGFELAEIRKAVGGSIRRLSAKECSDWIRHYGGGDLANPPGQKPRASDTKRKRPGVARMIDADHIDQICRLLVLYFGDDTAAAFAWLGKNFKECVAPPLVGGVGRSDVIRRLESAQRAGEVIRVLKQMIARRDARVRAATANRDAPARKRAQEATP